MFLMVVVWVKRPHGCIFRVPLAPYHRQFLRIAINVMPFVLSLALCVFIRCVPAAFFPIQAYGLKI